MKRPVCDSCGSTQFLTAGGGIKVCKYCGSQYFTEQDMPIVKTKYIAALTAVLCAVVIVFLPRFLNKESPEPVSATERLSGVVYYEAGREELLDGLENIEHLSWTREIFENITVAERDRTQTGAAGFSGGDQFSELVGLVGKPGADTSVRLTGYNLNYAVWNGVDPVSHNHIAVNIVYIRETGMITEKEITGGRNQFL